MLFNNIIFLLYNNDDEKFSSYNFSQIGTNLIIQGNCTTRAFCLTNIFTII